LELHYHKFFLKSVLEQTTSDDHEMEDAAGGSGETSGDETSAATRGGAETSGDETCAAARGGAKTSGDEPSDAAARGGVEPSGDEPSGAAGSSGTRISGAKRPRKAMRPNTVATCRDTVTEVDPKSGLPVEPTNVAKGYGNQLAAIL
jgi:hypothetical protein